MGISFSYLPYPKERRFSFTIAMGYYFGGLSRAGDVPVATVGSEAADDPIVRAEGDAPVATVGSDSTNAPPSPSGDAPVATAGSETTPTPAADGDAGTGTIGTEGA